MKSFLQICVQILQTISIMDLTLVIPTYNRPDSLGRLLIVLRTFGYDGQILIADSGSDKTKEENRRSTSAWDAVSYIEYPTNIAPFSKFAAAIALTQTKFVMLLADDDLAFPEGLSECVSFLNANPTYSAAHGHYLSYRMSGDRISIPNIEYSSPSIAANLPFDRLNSLMSNYQALTYAVQRKDTAQKAFEMASQQKDLLWQELAGNSLTVFDGPVKRMECFSHARQCGSTVGYSHWHPIEWLTRDAAGLFSGFAKYIAAIEGMAIGNCLTQSMPGDQIRHAANKAGLLYLTPYLAYSSQISQRAYPDDWPQDQKASAAIDHWNDLHVKFPASILLRYPRLGTFARTLKRNILDRYIGNYETSISASNGKMLYVRFGKPAVRAIQNMGGKREMNRLAKYFSRYLAS